MKERTWVGAQAVPRSGGRWISPRLLHEVLAYGFIFYTFIGTGFLNGFDAAERVEGNPLDRLVLLSLAAVSLVVGWNNRHALFYCIRSSLWLYLVVGFCVMSVLWSDYPDLTLRRSAYLLIVTIVATAVAVGITDLRRFHTILFIGLTVAIMMNLASIVVWPSFALTDIGVRGLTSQKNAAGIVAMIALITAVTWIIGADQRRSVLLGGAAAALAFIFLVLTRSKTSLGLSMVALLAIGIFVGAERYGPRFLFPVFAAAIVCLAIAFTAFAAGGFDFGQFFQLALGDSSFTGRDELWAFALRTAMARPWLGYGYGAFWDVGVANDPLQRTEPGTWLGDVEVGIINEAHNGYLDLWLQVGLPATVIATAFVAIAAIGISVRAMVDTVPRASRAMLGTFAILLFVFLLHNLVEGTLFARGAAFSNFAILAILVGGRAKYLISTASGSAASPAGIVQRTAGYSVP